MIKKSLSLLGVAVLALNLISCAGGSPRAGLLTAERPKDEAFRTQLKQEISSLNVSIEASAGELSDTLNRMVGKELYNGSTKSFGGTAKVLRNGPIVVGAADNFLQLTIPVSVSFSYGMFETVPITSKLKFKLAAKVTPDWKLSVDARYLGLSDGLAEDLRIGPISIKPRSMMDGITQPVQRTLSELISRKLNEMLPLKAEVSKVWIAAYKPILLDKGFHAWLQVTPRELLLYPLYAQNNQLKVSVGLKSYAEVVVGPEPPARAPAALPNLTLANGADKSFRVAVNTDLFYTDILDIAAPLLLNKELGSDGKSIVLKRLELNGNGDRLLVKVETTGTVDGIFYLTCRPVFNQQSNVFSVEDVDFDLQSKSLLLQSASWLLHGTIRDTIREKLNMDLSQRLVQAREMAGKAVAHQKLADNLFLTGNVKTVKVNDVMVQRDRISIQVYAEGETAIVLH